MGGTQNHTLEEIVGNGLCMGCGICRSVLGPEVLTHSDEEDGLERPREVRPMTAAEIQTLNAICPGINVSFPETESDATHDAMWGNIIRVTQGFASDSDVRFRAATGGALTALALHILETGKADYIVHLAADPERPLLSKTQRSYTTEDVIRGSGSRYAATAPLVDIQSALDDGKPFVFIGKPCDITALGNLARIDPRVDELCRYKLTLVCGGFSELSKFQELLAEWDMREGDVSRFSYRGYGCPGPTFAETRDGRRGETTYRRLWADEKSWRNFYRCKICPDAIGLSADIAALDIWDGGTPVGEDEGWNGFIVRTQAGRELLNDAVAAGAVTLDGELTIADLDNFQPHQTKKRHAVRARYAAMAEAGLPYPATEDPGLDDVSHPAGSDSFEREKSGTKERLSRGNHLRR